MKNIENGEFQVVEETIIWQDRKHHLWFPLSFTKYMVGDGRLYINTGFLSSREDECLLYRITDISLKRSLAQRLFGTGTIELMSKDQTTPVIFLENIRRPVQIKRMLSNLIEKERMEKKVVGRDMYGAAAHVDGESEVEDREEG